MTSNVELNWPLMANNITREDLDAVIEYLKQDDPKLTHSIQVRAFEEEWSEWLGVRYSVFVNSGASANLLTMAAFKELFGQGKLIVPPLTWVSDIASVLQNGFEPIFVDINKRSLGIESSQVIEKLSPDILAVFITHILGYNALTRELITGLKMHNIPLIEDVCESYGATFDGQKLGTFGLASNFSFYYAHHMSTIEGGMISTNDSQFYETVRMLRSHGMVRESSSDEISKGYHEQYPDLNPDFIFAFPGYNVRPTELNAVIGRSQLKRLDRNNLIRIDNLNLFLKNLDPEKYQTDFAVKGSCNYAFTLILKNPDIPLRDQVEKLLRQSKVEFRRGASGGGNQLRQPYIKRMLGDYDLTQFPNTEHVHFFGYYIGNYPDLEKEKILTLCRLLNDLEG